MKHEQGLGSEAMRTRLAPVFERHGVAAPVARSIDRHFENHVDMMRFQQSQELPELVLDDIDVALTDPEELALGKNDSDYHKMAELFLRLMNRIVAIDNDPYAFIDKKGDHAFTKLSAWASMVNNARQIIEGLSKMRNQDRAIYSIIQSHTRRFATIITGPVAAELRDIQNSLLASHDPAARQAAQRISDLLNGGFTNIMATAAQESLRESKSEYKLLH